jgi:plastocyanin
MSTLLGRIGYLLAGGALVWIGLVGTVPAVAAGDEPSPSAEATAEPTATPVQDESDGPSASPSTAEPAPSTSEPEADDPGPATADPDERSGGSGADRVRRAQQVGVDAVDDAFQPSQITVDAGDEVNWSSSGQNPHTVTADDGSFGSGTLQPGESFSTTFDAAGSFAYYCEFHGGAGGTGMSGVVVVRAAGGGDAAPATDESTDLPPTGRDLTFVVFTGLVLTIAGLASLLAGRRVARRAGTL